jgi:hypothetical protein
VSRIPDDIDWSLTTWEGVRREQLRRAAALTLRERLQSLEDMAEVAERFRQMRETGRFSATHSGSAAAPETEAHAARQPPIRYGAKDE